MPNSHDDIPSILSKNVHCHRHPCHDADCQRPSLCNATTGSIRAARTAGR